MIYTPENSKRMKLIDANGTEIPGAIEFNDETEEVKLYVLGRSHRIATKFVMSRDHQSEDGGFKQAPVIVSAVIKGARMVDR